MAVAMLFVESKLRLKKSGEPGKVASIGVQLDCTSRLDSANRASALGIRNACSSGAVSP